MLPSRLTLFSLALSLAFFIFVRSFAPSVVTFSFLQFLPPLFPCFSPPPSFLILCFFSAPKPPCSLFFLWQRCSFSFFFFPSLPPQNPSRHSILLHQPFLSSLPSSLSLFLVSLFHFFFSVFSPSAAPFVFLKNPSLSIVFLSEP
mgnify:CR=1 FL=1